MKRHLKQSPVSEEELRTTSLNSALIYDRQLTEKLSVHAAQAAVQQKAHDIKILYVGETSTIADYVLIASGTSDRHCRGIADRVCRELELLGEAVVHIDGREDANWIVLDFGNLIVHIFHEAARNYFDLDGLLEPAARVPLGAELEKEARTFRTGMFR